MAHRPLSLEKVKAYIKKEYLYLGALIGFIIIATVISSSFSRDSEAYNRLFEMYGASGWDALFTEMFQRETFFLVVSKILYPLGLGSVFLFLIYSAISLSVKFYLINERSKDKWLSLAFFASYFFILHDSTQIRFSVAVAFAYLGLHSLAHGKKLLFSCIIIFSAILFHVSVIVFIVMLFFTSKKSTIWLVALVLVAVLLYPLNLVNVFSGITENVINYFDLHGTFLNKLYASYLHEPAAGTRLSMFSLRMFMVYFCIFVIFQYRSVFSRYDLLCFNALIFSVFIYILMKDILIIPFRLSGLFGFSLVFLVPYIHQWLSEWMKEKYAYAILLSFFVITLLKFTIYDKMIII